MPKVSICIPTYNRKHYLKQTLQSIFSQTYHNYEVVVLDDGSSDGTDEMVHSLKYPIKYLRQDNKGEPAARNKLIQMAQGQYITFIDSDDILFPYAVEELMRVIASNSSDVIAYSSYVGIDESGKEVNRKQHRQPSGCIAADLFEYIYVHSCGTLCKKELIKDAGGFDESLPVCSPYALWLKLSLKYNFIPASRPTFKRRRHIGNLSMYSFQNRKTELYVLEQAYQNGFGESTKESLTPQRAMRRLSKEGYRAARCAIREGKQDIAFQLLKQSYQRYPNFKALFWLTIAAAKICMSQ